MTTGPVVIARLLGFRPGTPARRQRDAALVDGALAAAVMIRAGATPVIAALG